MLIREFKLNLRVTNYSIHIWAAISLHCCITEKIKLPIKIKIRLHRFTVAVIWEYNKSPSAFKFHLLLQTQYLSADNIIQAVKVGINPALCDNFWTKWQRIKSEITIKVDCENSVYRQLLLSPLNCQQSLVFCCSRKISKGRFNKTMLNRHACWTLFRHAYFALL